MKGVKERKAMNIIQKLIILSLICYAYNGLAIQINNANSTHERFIDYPNNPSNNSNYILANRNEISAIGWRANLPQFSMTLIHPQFLLIAYHARPAIGEAINFMNNAGVLKSYTVAAVYRITDGADDTDLGVVELTVPIPSADNISAVAIGSATLNQTIYPYGKFALTAIETVSQVNYPFETTDGTMNIGVTFDYFTAIAQVNEAYSESGDSGSPTFILENNELKIVGVRSSLQTFLNAGDQIVGYRTVDVCTACYQSQIDQIIAKNEIVALAIAPKILLQGAYDSNTGLMRDDLRTNNVQDLVTSPYADQMTASSSVFNSGGTDGTGDPEDDVFDWVWVELRDESDNTISLAGRSALLQRDGDVVEVDGRSPLTLSGKRRNYFIVITHRNHLGVMTATSVALSD